MENVFGIVHKILLLKMEHALNVGILLHFVKLVLLKVVSYVFKIIIFMREHVLILVLLDMLMMLLFVLNVK